MIFFDKTSPINSEDIIHLANESGLVVLIDKSLDWTSFDAIAKLRFLTKIKKIGHAGTLDPLATGLLIVCIGRKATKRINEFQDLKKKYSAIIKLGATTKTNDTEGEEENIKDTQGINREQIIQTCNSFIGEIEQVPPMYSAKKVNGQRLYKLARKNMEISLPPCSVEIYSLVLKKIEMPFLTVDIECSKGTYIRALARDIGNSLGCGAYLHELRRTDIGKYSVNSAFTIMELIEYFEK